MGYRPKRKRPHRCYTLAMVTRSLLLTSILAGLMGHATAQAVPLPSVPEQMKAPAGEEVILVGHATGSQIYGCDLAGGTYAWKLKAPDAELRDAHGAVIIYHFAGPA